MSEPMTMIDAGDLTLRDIGRTVTIRYGEATITGTLRDLRAETAWISEQAMTAAEEYAVAGRQTLEVAVGVWRTSRLPMGTRVEVAR